MLKLFALCFFFVTICSVSGSILDLNLPPSNLKSGYDLTAGGSYSAEGLHSSRFIEDDIASPPYNPVHWVLDVENERLYINHTNNVHYFFNNVSYFMIPQFPGSPCFIRNDYNFTTHIHNYMELSTVAKGVIKFPKVINIYHGGIYEHHACSSTRIAVYVEQDYISKRLTGWVWSAPLYIEAANINTFVVQSVTIDSFSSNIPSSVFNLPPQCQNPIDFDWFFSCH